MTKTLENLWETFIAACEAKNQIDLRSDPQTAYLLGYAECRKDIEEWFRQQSERLESSDVK
jgi:hypothetical protein